MIRPPYKVYISSPLAKHLSDAQIAVQKRVIDLVKQKEFTPWFFAYSGDSQLTPIPWTFGEVKKFIRQCQGVIILGLARWDVHDPNGEQMRFITEYSHYEGALAHMLNLPTLLVREEGVADRGVLYSGAGENVVKIVPDLDGSWLQTSAFMPGFEAWAAKVSRRSHVFLGYSSSARPTAALVKDFLESSGVQVMDWKYDFRAGKSVLEQIEEAEQRCLGGIFLFMKDDVLLTKDEQLDAPRDNVVFEAGYFMNTKGHERTLLICERGVKILSDLKGMVYLELKDRDDISSVENGLSQFIKESF